MACQFRNLVFEGGGVKGIAYVGAMEVLEQRGILGHVNRVGGTSAGAINAALFALGFSNRESRRLMKQIDFRTFLDDEWGIVRDARRLSRQFGWYKGDYFHEWMRERVAAKLGKANASFGDLQTAGRPDLYVYGTNLSTNFGEVFSVEQTPHMPIADAVRISMSIPLLFTAVRNERRDVYVDGGVLNNYPVKLFDRLRYVAKGERREVARRTVYYRSANAAVRSSGYKEGTYIYNRQTLGFRLDTEKEIVAFRDGIAPVRRDIDDFFDYVSALVTAAGAVQANQHLHSDDWQRTLYIDTLGVAATDFNISNRRKDALIKSGRDGAMAYLRWFNSRNSEPINRCAD